MTSSRRSAFRRVLDSVPDDVARIGGLDVTFPPGLLKPEGLATARLPDGRELVAHDWLSLTAQEWLDSVPRRHGPARRAVEHALERYV